MSGSGRLIITSGGTLNVTGGAKSMSRSMDLAGSLLGDADLTITESLGWTDGAIAGTGSLTVGGTMTAAKVGGVLTMTRRLTVGGPLLVNYTFALAPGLSGAGLTPRVGGLTLAPGAVFDLTDNAMVIDYSGASPLASIAAWVREAYAGGSWTSSGIGSSTAAATSGTAIGFGESSALFSSFPTMFAGEAVDSTAILIRYTAAGDANLDRRVDFADLLVVAQNYGTTGRSFGQGNLDYSSDGAVGFSDLLIVAQRYGTSLLSTEPKPSVFGSRSIGRFGLLGAEEAVIV